MTSLFARNERLLWRTRFSTTEMPSQFLTQYNTIKSWQFSLFSLKLSLQSTHVHERPSRSLQTAWHAVCRLHGHRAVCRLREVSRLHGTSTFAMAIGSVNNINQTIAVCFRKSEWTTPQLLHCTCRFHVACSVSVNLDDYWVGDEAVYTLAHNHWCYCNCALCDTVLWIILQNWERCSISIIYLKTLKFNGISEHKLNSNSIRAG